MGRIICTNPPDKNKHLHPYPYFEHALSKVKWNIIGLSETKRYGEELLVRKNGNWLFNYGETKGYRGVGFYVRNNKVNQIIEIKGINERIPILKLKINASTNLSIIQIYAPTSIATEAELDEFYQFLDETYAVEK